MKHLLAVAFSAGMATAGTPQAPAAELATVPGNASKWAASTASVGAAPAEQQVTIAVHMALRDASELKRVADEVSRPDSPSYGRYLAPTAFEQAFAPDPADIEAVKTMLAAGGMTGLKVGPAGAYVEAHATVAQLRETFKVSQDVYQRGTLRLRANKEDPTIPRALAGKVLFIEGLDETGRLRKPMHRSMAPHTLAAPAVAPTQGETPLPVADIFANLYCDKYYGDLEATLSTKPSVFDKRLPWRMCGYTPQQIQTAYGFDKTDLDGSGVTVAIIDAYASPTLLQDSNAYAANHDLPPLTDENFTQILPEGIYDVPADQLDNAYGWWMEQSLDLAAVHGSAPGAKIVYVGSTSNDIALTFALLDAIYNRQADIISNSYSFSGEDDSNSPGDMAMQEQAFIAAAAEGVTVLFASGDYGDLAADNGVASGSFEATCPYVTGVGGTTMLLTSPAGDKKEYGWSGDFDFLQSPAVVSGTSITTAGLQTTSVDGETFDAFLFGGGSGGGVSLVYPQPDYQAKIVPDALSETVNEASGDVVNLLQPNRVTPDVAMVGDPQSGYLFGESFTTSSVASRNTGCVATGPTTEYCEESIGGTSLSTPLMAGAIALMDEARLARGKAFVGFANPLFYSLRQGAGSGFRSAALNQIVPPTKPLAFLVGFVDDYPLPPTMVTINSVPQLIVTAPFLYEVCGLPICEGLDDEFNYVTPGYNDVTGLGVPYLPKLVKQ